MEKIRIGIAGLGFIGPAHLEALRRIPGLEVVAALHSGYESTVKKAAQFQVPVACRNFDDLLSQDIQVVHICTPNHLHFEQAKKALQEGLHVVCEKPLATTVQEAEELLALAESKNLVHAVHFNIRYYPLVRQMKVLREQGQLGEVYSILGSYLQDWLFYQSDYNWRLETEKSGESRAIADIGSHLIDLLEYISGMEIVEVFADFDTIHPVRKKPMKPVETYAGKILKPEDYQDVAIHTEDYATVLLRFANGRKGVVTVSQVSAGRKNRLTLEIAGSKQTWNWCSEQPNELWIGHRDQPNQQLLRDPSLAPPEAAGLMAFPGGHNEGFPDTSKQMFREIYQAIREGKTTDPSYPTFKDGLRELILCERILESNKKQQWIKI